MRRRLTGMMLLGAAMLVTAPYARRVLATPATGGFASTTLVMGRFGDINVFNHLIPPDFWKSRHHSDIWLSRQKTKGLSDVYVQSNMFPPRASSGWHTHPGHSLIIVAGTVTAYDGDDRDCTPHVYTQGMGFADPGGDHVHNIRNEDAAVEARTIVVQLIPADAMRRIDVADPGNCTF